MTNKIEGETGASLKVTSTLVDQYLKVAIVDDQGVEYVSNVSDAVTTTELALKSVEDASGGNYNILIAYFNKSVGNLQPADVQIRKVSDNTLYSVEKVTVSSDGLTATLTLSNSTATGGSGTTKLAANTDYKLIVTSNGETAEKAFTIPATTAGVTVTAVDSEKKTISVEGLAAKYEDTQGLISDFNEILGRTVTFTYDKNRAISSFKLIDEDVIYSAITAKDADKDGNIDTIVDTDENEYSLVATTVGDIHATQEVVLDGYAGAFEAQGTISDPAETAKYAKIALNGNGSVRSLVTVYDWDKSVYVKEVKDSKYLVDMAGAYTDLTDFTILKDGKTATIADVVAGDVVFVSTDNTCKIAEIYSTNTKSGTMKVYTGKIDIASDRFDIAPTVDAYAVIGDKVQAATTANLTDYDGSEVVGYLDRANALSQVVVSSETAATASEFVVLTEDAIMYTEGADVIVSFKAGNGTAVDTYKVKVGDLKDIKVGTSDLKYDKTTNKYVNGTITATNKGKFGIGATNTTYGVTVDGNGDLLAGDLVKVVKNAEGTIIGLELSNGEEADYDFYTTQDKDMATTQTTNDKFEGKMTAVAQKSGVLIESATPVYVYNTTNKTVVKYAYKDVVFDGVADALNQIQMRVADGKVAAFYLDETKTSLGESLVDTTVRAIIDSVTYDKAGDNYAEIVAYVGSEKVTYKTFAQDVAKLAAGEDDKGDFVDIKLTADGAVYSMEDVTETSADIGEFVTETYHIDDDYILNTESGVTTTILVKAADGTYSTKTWSELGTLKDEMGVIKVALYGSTSKFVDAIYVELDGGAAQAQNAADAAATAATLTAPAAYDTASAVASNTTAGYTYAYSIALKEGETLEDGAPTATINATTGAITCTAGTSDSTANYNTYTITVTATDANGVVGTTTHELVVADTAGDAIGTCTIDN